MKMIEILKIEKDWPPVSTAAAAGLASRRGCGQQYHFVILVWLSGLRRRARLVTLHWHTIYAT